MAAGVLFFLYTLTQKTIPAILQRQREDLASILGQQRQDLGDTRAEFRGALKDQQDLFRASLASVEERWQRATDAICTKLDANDRHTQANEAHLQVLRDLINRGQGLGAGPPNPKVIP